MRQRVALEQFFSFFNDYWENEFDKPWDYARAITSYLGIDPVFVEKKKNNLKTNTTRVMLGHQNKYINFSTHESIMI